MSNRSLHVAIGLLLLAAPLWGCGTEVKPASLAGAQKAFEQAESSRQQNQLQSAEQSYLAAFNAAEAVLKTLVPGDKLLPDAERIRNESAKQIARIREDLRKQEVTSSRQVAMAGRGAPAKNLPPPVAPYTLSAPEKAPETPAVTPDGPKPPAGEKPPVAPGPADMPKPDPGAGEAPKPAPPAGETPKTPAGAKELRITKAVIKGKTVQVFWTFSNPAADKELIFGAPAGRVTTKGGGKTLLSLRETFLKAGYEFNAQDPLASQGTSCKPNGFKLAPGENRELVTVGAFADEAAAAQAGAVVIELRMSEGEDLSDKFMDVVPG